MKTTRFDFFKKLLVLGLLFLFSSHAKALSYTLEISEAELQEKLSQIMPLEKKKLFISVIFSHPKIDLAVGNNQIGFYTQIDVVAPGGINSTGSAKIKGSLSYEGSQGAFYFKNPVLVDMQLRDIPNVYLPSIKEIAQLIINNKLSSIALYKLKNDDLEQSLLKYTLKSIVVENRQLLIELVLF